MWNVEGGINHFLLSTLHYRSGYVSYWKNADSIAEGSESFL